MTLGESEIDGRSTHETGQLDREQNFQSYEVNKYMQKNIKPIHMPHMTSFKRANDHDPGQSS
jgi:hypothetical protein